MLFSFLISVLPLIPQDPIPLDKPAPKTERVFELMVGDFAPPVDIATWVKGEPVAKALPKGQVYLIDFWAKWCGPCLRSMPHLSKLQDEHQKAGFVVLSITTEDSKGNTLDAVETLVESKKKDMRFRVAWDRNRNTYDAWMTAAGRNTIPSAFLVDREGRIAFIGNPAQLGSALDEVLTGKFDLEAATQAYAKTALATAAKRKAVAHAKGILERVQVAQKRRDWPAVLAGYDELIGLAPQYQDYIVHRFSTMLIRMQEPARAYGYALEIAEGTAKKREDLLCKMARLILDSPAVPERDFGIALALAMQADELTKGVNAHNAETVARACHLLGDLEGAVEAARRAVQNAPKTKIAQYENMLKRFEALQKKAR